MYATLDLKAKSNLGEGKSLKLKAASASTEKLCLNSTNNFWDNIFSPDFPPPGKNRPRKK